MRDRWGFMVMLAIATAIASIFVCHSLLSADAGAEATDVRVSLQVEHAEKDDRVLLTAKWKGQDAASLFVICVQRIRDNWDPSEDRSSMPHVPLDGLVAVKRTAQAEGTASITFSKETMTAILGRQFQVSALIVRKVGVVIRSNSGIKGGGPVVSTLVIDHNNAKSEFQSISIKDTTLATTGFQDVPSMMLEGPPTGFTTQSVAMDDVFGFLTVPLSRERSIN